MVNRERLRELFLSLCRINSPALNERAIVAWTKEYLSNQGLEVHEDQAGAKIGGNANNLIVWLRGNLEDAPKVFLSAHFDTVEPTEALQIIEDGGVIRSAGNTILGADDYAGMAPAIEAVLSLKESGLSHGDVCLLLSVAEEIGLKGADAMEIQDLGLDFGYVLDTGPPVGSYVTRTAFHDKMDVTITGKPAHAGKDPEKGINAIQVLAEAVHGMSLGRIDPETTANVGLINGGTAVNVVCPFVTVRAEARSTNLEVLERQIAHMRTRFEEAAAKWGASVQIDYRRHYSAYQIDENSPVVTLGINAAKSLGLNAFTRTTLGGSDANVFNAKGLPSIVMATGMEKIHTHEEFVSEDDLLKTAQLAYGVLLEAAKHRIDREAGGRLQSR